jgi:hypothetical protein
VPVASADLVSAILPGCSVSGSDRPGFRILAFDFYFLQLLQLVVIVQFLAQADHFGFESLCSVGVGRIA